MMCAYRPNIYLDLSDHQSAARKGNAAGAIRVAVSRGINHKILFGTDWPVYRMQGNQQSLVEAVMTEDGPLSELNDVDKANILYKNAERLLGMSR
jgi:hypothetical protein